ncbi:MAG: class I SAM-dependent methyltransferase [Colwellia sp.]|nr:class I SAM-dependent methyltransferase [Colwellia sp.]
MQSSRHTNCSNRPPNCRICDQRLHQFLDLGKHPRADTYRRPGDHSSELMFELKVGVCESCQLVQLIDEVPPEMMFNSDYPFRTSSSQRMQQHFRETALEILDFERHTNSAPFIVEFGCNDGSFLDQFAKLGIMHLGIDPASNLVSEAVDRGVNAKTGWFNTETAAEILESARPATVIYAANTFCHISDLASVFRGVDLLLAEDGRFIFEDPYLGDIVTNCAFDQIYDEHIYYFSATSVDLIARKFGMKLIDVDHIETHGGQLRYSVGRQHQTQSRSVEDFIENERKNGLHSVRRLKEFAETVEARRSELPKVLRGLLSAGKTVAGYAATAKSSTVLNYCGIDRKLLQVIYDTTPEKQGRLTPGTGIPIESFPRRIEDYPDIFLLFAWNHEEEIISREAAFRALGGSWLKFVPSVTLEPDL